MIRRIWEALVVGAAGIVYILIASDKDPDTQPDEPVESGRTPIRTEGSP